MAVGADEGVVGAALGDAGLVEDQDEIGPAQGGEAMGHHEGGAAFHGDFHGGHDFVFGFRVDGGGGVVKDEDGGFEDDGPGEGEALAWPPERVEPCSPMRVS